MPCCFCWTKKRQNQHEEERDPRESGVVEESPNRDRAEEIAMAPSEVTLSQCAVVGNEKPVDTKEHLKECIDSDYEAYSHSGCDEEKATAAENLGMSSWRMARAEEEDLEKASLLLHYYKESFKYFSEAYMKGQKFKPSDWLDNIRTHIKSCWDEFRSGYIKLRDLDTRVRIYYDVIRCIDIEDVKAEWYFEIATCHFHIGVTAIQEKDFKTALYQMQECNMPIQEAKSKGGNSGEFLTECGILQEDVNVHYLMAESMQALHTGDNLLAQLLMEEESLNMDMVWEVVDWYKQAVLRTREVTEVEMEAIALSRLGKIYDKVLKLKSKAKEYVKKSVELANSMHPRTFHREEWFKDALEIIERYQKEVVQQESEKWNKERQEVLDTMKEEMELLKKNDESNNSHIEFVKYVYKTYPPKKKEHTLESIAEMKEEFPSSKKVLFSAIIHFHPDRNGDHGSKWKVIAEEITKMLTRRYELLK